MYIKHIIRFKVSIHPSFTCKNIIMFNVPENLKCSAFSPVWNTADFPRSFAASAECFNLIAMITN